MVESINERLMSLCDIVITERILRIYDKIRLQRNCYTDYRKIVIKQLEIQNFANGGRKRYYILNHMHTRVILESKYKYFTRIREISSE